MGARGPKPLPANVHMLRGNPSKLAASDLRSELRPPVEIPNCPRELQGAARAEWKRVGAELEALGLVAKIDRAMLSFYCVEWARWVWATSKIDELNAADPKGEAGYVDATSSGYKVHSVYLQIARKAQEACHKFAADFGMSPSARSRVTPGDAGQLDLPGVDPSPSAPSSPTLGAFAQR